MLMCMRLTIRAPRATGKPAPQILAYRRSGMGRTCVVRNAHAGSTIGALAPTTTPVQAQPGVTTSSPLTAREREVLELMSQGVTAVQIARMLNISVHTCRGYMKSIHAKLGVRSQLEAVVRAQALGLLERRR